MTKTELAEVLVTAGVLGVQESNGPSDVVMVRPTTKNRELLKSIITPSDAMDVRDNMGSFLINAGRITLITRDAGGLGALGDDHCRSCGMYWKDHKSLAAVCADLQSARLELSNIRAQKIVDQHELGTEIATTNGHAED